MLKLLNLLCLCFIYCKSLNLAKFYRRLQLLLGTFIPVPTQTQRISSMCFKAQKNKALQDCKETGGRAKPLWCWRSSLKSTPGFLGPYLTFQVLLVAEDHVEPGCMTLAQCPMSPGHRTRSCQPPVTAHTREQTAIPGDPFCTVMLKRKPGDDKMRFNSIAKKKIFFKEDPLSLYFQVYSQKSGYWSTASQTWNSGCQVAKTPLQIYSSQNFLNFLQL